MKVFTTRGVRSLASYLSRVEEVSHELIPASDAYLWFRGHGSEDWSLLPSLYRESYRKSLSEDDCRHEYRRLAWPYLSASGHEPRSDWDWYFMMQHYELPTRLLDWTESALVALYFAVGAAGKERDAAVWALDPWALNRRVAKRGDVVLTSEDATRYLNPPFSTRALPRRPIAIESPYKTRRIAAQRGAFTVHGSSARSLETYPELRCHIAKIPIRQSSIRTIRAQLRTAGMTETTVFPELPALARELIDYWQTA